MNLLIRAISKVGGFGSTVLISGVVGLVSIPLVVFYAGAQSWAAVAVGQSGGAVLSVLIGLGWVQTGPAAIARASRTTRAQIMHDSVILRHFTALFALPIGVIVFVFAMPALDPFILTAGITSTAIIALGNSWVFVGLGSPSKLMLFDTLPRVAGIGLGSLAVMITNSAFIFCLCASLGAALSAGLSSLWLRYNFGPGKQRPISSYFLVFRSQLAGAGIGVFSTFYLAVPILVLSAMHPVNVAVYALVDRIRQQGMTAITPIAQALQGWVPSAEADQLFKRVWSAARAGIVLAFMSAIIFIAGAPLATVILGAGELEVDYGLIVPLGIAFGLNVLTLVIGSSCLIPISATRLVLFSAAIGAGVVIVMLVLLVPQYGAVGTAWSVAVAQASVAIVQVLGLTNRLSEFKRR